MRPQWLDHEISRWWYQRMITRRGDGWGQRMQGSIQSLSVDSGVPAGGREASHQQLWYEDGRRIGGKTHPKGRENCSPDLGPKTKVEVILSTAPLCHLVPQHIPRASALGPDTRCPHKHKREFEERFSPTSLGICQQLNQQQPPTPTPGP